LELFACRANDHDPIPRRTATARPHADLEAAARKLIEIANPVEAVQDGRIYIGLLKGQVLFEHKASPAEYSAGLKLAIDRGWLALDLSGA
jgi:hypothetical protein